MFKTKVTYENFNGETETEELYFHLSVPEFMNLKINDTEESTEDYLKRIIDEGDKTLIFKALTDLMLLSYGEKSEDGRRFIKNKEKAKEFEETEAFSQMILLIATNEEIQTAFLKGIIPDVKNKQHTKNISSDTSNKMIDVSSSIKEYSKDDVDRLVKEEIDRMRSEKSI